MSHNTRFIQITCYSSLFSDEMFIWFWIKYSGYFYYFIINSTSTKQVKYIVLLTIDALLLYKKELQ